jgi:hypothetical protein
VLEKKPSCIFVLGLPSFKNCLRGIVHFEWDFCTTLDGAALSPAHIAFFKRLFQKQYLLDSRKANQQSVRLLCFLARVFPWEKSLTGLYSVYTQGFTLSYRILFLQDNGIVALNSSILPGNDDETGADENHLPPLDNAVGS